MSTAVAVIGGTGVFGQYIVEGLLQSPIDFSITVAARNKKTFDKVFSVVSPRLTFQSVDLTNPASLEQLLDGIQIVILAAGPFQGFTSQLALTASRMGVHYIDICDDPAYIERLITVSKELNQSKALLLSGLSSLPGISMRLIDIAHNRFDRIDSVSIGLFIGNSNKKGHGAVMSSLDSLDKTASVIENGQHKEIPVWSDKELYLYPKPIGVIPSYSFNSPDALLAAQHFKIRDLRVKVGFEWRLARWSFLFFKLATKFCSVRLIKGLVRGLFPLFSWFHRFGSERGCVSVIMRGHQQNEIKTVRASLLGLEKGQRMASLPAVIAAEAIANNEVRGTGLTDLISWLPSKAFLDKLQQKGFELRIEELN